VGSAVQALAEGSCHNHAVRAHMSRHLWAPSSARSIRRGCRAGAGTLRELQSQEQQQQTRCPMCGALRAPCQAATPACTPQHMRGPHITWAHVVHDLGDAARFLVVIARLDDRVPVQPDLKVVARVVELLRGGRRGTCGGLSPTAQHQPYRVLPCLVLSHAHAGRRAGACCARAGSAPRHRLGPTRLGAAPRPHAHILTHAPLPAWLFCSRHLGGIHPLAGRLQ